MSKANGRLDYQALPEKYRAYHDAIAFGIPASRIYCDPFRTLAYGTDASFYRLIPKIVVKVRTPEEVTLLLLAANRLAVPVTFRAAGTPVPGHRPTTTIVRTGPYRFSRNPIYLSFSLLQLGLALWIDSLWLIVTLLPAVALMAFVVIPREEQYLEARFPLAYPSYKASVRRWL